jgi:excisionase family DNA binding protein
VREAGLATTTIVTKRWYTVQEVAEQLGFGLTKTKMLVVTGEIRSVKHGHHRRIPAAAVDEFVRQVERQAT